MTVSVEPFVVGQTVYRIGHWDWSEPEVTEHKVVAVAKSGAVSTGFVRTYGKSDGKRPSYNQEPVFRTKQDALDAIVRRAQRRYDDAVAVIERESAALNAALDFCRENA